MLNNPEKSFKEYILVTGGAGYIGSHTSLELLLNNYNVIILDKLSNTNCIKRIRQILEIKKKEGITVGSLEYVNLDILDKIAVQNLFESNSDIVSVIHFAALKSVSESWSNPMAYYNINVTGTLNILEAMIYHPKCDNFVFSSSACVYGEAKEDELPILETAVCIPVTPYARSKLFVEEIIKDLCRRYNGSEGTKVIRSIILRYFNPVGNKNLLKADDSDLCMIGAHDSGLIGENPLGTPQNLMPLVAQVAAGKRDCVNVYGNDYDTKDGTGCRDYIHVVDLAEAHVKAVEKVVQLSAGTSNRADIKLGWNCPVYNLGTGTSISVFEILYVMERVIGRKIKHKICPRRLGDVGNMYANIDKAKEDLRFSPKRNLEDMCRDLWRWQTENPKGYDAD